MSNNHLGASGNAAAPIWVSICSIHARRSPDCSICRTGEFVEPGMESASGLALWLMGMQTEPMWQRGEYLLT